MSTKTPNDADGLPSDVPAEISVLKGVYLLYWKIDEVVDSINISPALSQNERQLLVNLASPRRMGAFAAEMQVLPSTLTALADGMAEKGLLYRERDPDDRRSWRLCLTPEGAMKRQILMARAAEIFSNVSGLSPENTKTLALLMQEVTRNIEANGLPEGARPCQ